VKRNCVIVGLGLRIVVLVAAIAGVSFMRKDLPYKFDIVPINNGISITNLVSWNKRDLTVRCRSHDGHLRSRTLIPGSENHCILHYLSPGRSYTVRIARADLTGKLLYSSFQTEVTVTDPPPEYVVLVGASVGESWDFPSLPARVGAPNSVFGFRPKLGYDKRDVLDRLVAVPTKPDKVIIKECAAYMPREVDNAIGKIPGWVDMLRSRDIVPILATCCPVTEANDKANPGRQKAIEKFNDFIRSYAADHGVEVLDLEKALRIGDVDRRLKEEFAQTDGLHLMPEAYTVLDRMAPTVLITDH